MPKIEVGEQTLAYEALGPEAGQPLLLMHGFSETGRHLLAVAVNLTPAGYRVIVPDLPGYGRSVPPNRTFPPRFYERDALWMGQFLDALAIDSAHIMGFSDGGEVALLLASLRPERCRSVITWGATGSIPPEVRQYAQQIAPAMLPASRANHHPGQTIAGWTQQWLSAFLAHGDDISLSRASHIQCPTLMMVGEHDGLNPLTTAQRYCNAISGSPRSVVLFPGAGHAIHDEQPGPFLETVLSFLKTVK